MSARMMTMLLAILCLVLATLLVLPYQPPGLTNHQKPIKDLASVTQEPQQRTISIDDYATFTARPVFSAKRSPYVKQITKSVPASATTVITTPAAITPEISAPLPDLIGILTVNNSEMAFVLAKDESELVGLKVGEQYKKWTLSVIETNQIKMTYNGKEEIINLDWTKMDMLNDYIGKTNIAGQDDLNSDSFDHSESMEIQNLKDRLARQLQGSQ